MIERRALIPAAGVSILIGALITAGGWLLPAAFVPDPAAGSGGFRTQAYIIQPLWMVALSYILYIAYGWLYPFFWRRLDEKPDPFDSLIGGGATGLIAAAALTLVSLLILTLIPLRVAPALGDQLAEQGLRYSGQGFLITSTLLATCPNALVGGTLAGLGGWIGGR